MSTHSAFTLENGEFGVRAVLSGAWSLDYLNACLSNGVVELELKQGRGWHGNDLDFLSELPMLKVFDIFDFNIKNIAAIHRLKNLKRLNVTTYCSTKIDFAAFPFLESCAIEWRPKAKSLFDCVTLKRLFATATKVGL